jgi:hypothetical protein
MNACHSAKSVRHFGLTSRLGIEYYADVKDAIMEKSKKIEIIS